jgi:hypothetical protein
MHRSNYLPLTSALALATAVALIGMAGALSTAPAVSVPSSSRLSNEATNIALVREFYAAVNEALRTGDVTPPDRLVSADRGVPPLLGDGQYRATVARRLVSIRAIYTGAQVVVDDLLAQGDVVMARVRLERAARSWRFPYRRSWPDGGRWRSSGLPRVGSSSDGPAGSRRRFWNLCSTHR